MNVCGDVVVECPGVCNWLQGIMLQGGCLWQIAYGITCGTLWGVVLMSAPLSILKGGDLLPWLLMICSVV